VRRISRLPSEPAGYLANRQQHLISPAFPFLNSDEMSVLFSKFPTPSLDKGIPVPERRQLA
jgi:hypothetical protein